MSTEKTRHMIKAYSEEALNPMFLSGFFQSPPDNYYDAAQISIDVRRADHQVAIPVNSENTGYRRNRLTGYTNKLMSPPVYMEAGSISAEELKGYRAFGRTQYDEPGLQARAVEEAIRLARQLELKINRAIELQASQILTTGKLAIKNAANATVFELDFKPKNTHFFQSSSAWGGGSEKIFEDLMKAATEIRQNGHSTVENILCGEGSLEAMKNNADFQKRFNLLDLKSGQIVPPVPGADMATYHGTVTFGNNRAGLWSYDGYYEDPYTGELAKYLPDDMCAVLGKGRLDATYCRVEHFDSPNIVDMPISIPRGGSARKLFFKNWVEPDGTTLQIGVSAKPLLIPTAIDTFCCIDTQWEASE